MVNVIILSQHFFCLVTKILVSQKLGLRSNQTEIWVKQKSHRFLAINDTFICLIFCKTMPQNDMECLKMSVPRVVTSNTKNSSGFLCTDFLCYKVLFSLLQSIITVNLQQSLKYSFVILHLK